MRAELQSKLEKLDDAKVYEAVVKDFKRVEGFLKKVEDKYEI